MHLFCHPRYACNVYKLGEIMANSFLGTRQRLFRYTHATFQHPRTHFFCPVALQPYVGHGIPLIGEPGMR